MAIHKLSNKVGRNEGKALEPNTAGSGSDVESDQDLLPGWVRRLDRVVWLVFVLLGVAFLCAGSAMFGWEVRGFDGVEYLVGPTTNNSGPAASLRERIQKDGRINVNNADVELAVRRCFMEWSSEDGRIREVLDRLESAAISLEGTPRTLYQANHGQRNGPVTRRIASDSSSRDSAFWKVRKLQMFLCVRDALGAATQLGDFEQKLLNDLISDLATLEAGGPV